MSRQKKDGHYLNCYLDAQVYDTLCRYAEEAGQTKTLALERILRQFFETNGFSAEQPERKDESNHF